MIIAKQRLIIFGKLFEENEIINNNIFGKMYSKEEIINRLNSKGYKYEIRGERVDVDEKEDVKNKTKDETKTNRGK